MNSCKSNDEKGMVEAKMKEKLRRFMQGRYGVDELAIFLIGLSVLAMFLSRMVNNYSLYYMGLVLIIWSYFRVFSKNTYKCTQQNQKYLKLKAKVIKPFEKQINLFKQRKTHHIYSCPNCKQKIRIPKGRGKVEVTCPKCHKKFSKIS